MSDRPELFEALCTHEVLRRLGFKAEEIYLETSIPLTEGPAEFLGSIQVRVVLRAQCREFTIAIGFVRGVERDALCDEWKDLVARFNRIDGGKTFWEDIYEKSKAREMAAPLMLRLMEKGFVLKKLTN